MLSNGSDIQHSLHAKGFAEHSLFPSQWALTYLVLYAAFGKCTCYLNIKINAQRIALEQGRAADLCDGSLVKQKLPSSSNNLSFQNLKQM